MVKRVHIREHRKHPKYATRYVNNVKHNDSTDDDDDDDDFDDDGDKRWWHTERKTTPQNQTI